MNLKRVSMAGNSLSTIVCLPSRNDVDVKLHFCNLRLEDYRRLRPGLAKGVKRRALSDASMVYQADTRRFGELFGCDAALYLSIEKWESQ
jgi:hypothetical protein